jgi:hypothetical protein
VILSYQLAGAVEAMQPLMNMITFTARNREKIISLHTDIADALEQRNQQQIEHALLALSDYTKNLADNVFAAKQKIKTDIDNQKAQS